MKPFVNTKINVAMSDVCTTTLDPAEFNTMVKQGKLRPKIRNLTKPKMKCT